MRLINSCRLISALLLIAFQAHSAASQTQALPGHVPTVVSALHLQPLGRLPASQQLSLAIGLPLHHRDALTNLLRQIYDPTSPNCHHYLTPEQFNEQFGPTDQDYQSLITFAREHALTVTATHPNRMVLDVSASVATVETAFNVRLQLYRHPTENRMFYAPDREPSLDPEVPVLHIEGLDNYLAPHPTKLPPPLSDIATNQPYAGTGLGGSFLGTDLRKAYLPGVLLTGAGQSVGLMEFAGYFTNDIALYAKSNGLAGANVTNVLIDGFSGAPVSNFLGQIEAALDIEMVVGLAPGAQVIVYEQADVFSPASDDMLNRMATDNLAKQISSSWSFDVDATAQQIFQELAAQGQAFFGSSGDNGAYLPGQTGYLPEWTIVGGTVLQTGSGGQWSSETAWSGSGGGITGSPIPGWQTNLSMTANHGSTTYRNGPDVSMVAENLSIFYNNGVPSYDGGTSASAPLWAAFTALANQQAALYGIAGIGSLNPALYAIASRSNYPAYFHDITVGNNTNSASTTNYFAVPGFDLCTGLGTPNGSNLLNALAVAAPPVVIFSATPTIGITPPLTVQFTSPNTNSQGGGIHGWNWNFGDGSTSTLQNPSHTYLNAGVFQPTLVASNAVGFAIMGSGPSVTLYDASVAFTASLTNGPAPLAVQFTTPGIDSGGHAIAQWSWNFGDGSTGTGPSPAHTYTNAGSFQPSLILTNNLGLIDVGVGPAVLVYTSPSQFQLATNNGVISILGYTGPGGAVIIPASLNGLPVGNIDGSAFYNLTTVTSIFIPLSVTSIGQGAFLYCQNLTNIDVDGANAMYGSLAGVLFDKARATLIQFPPGLTGNYVIPDGVTDLADYAFYDCPIAGVVFPASLGTIGAWTFSFCSSLTTVTIPSGTTAIGEGAFSACYNLQSINVAGNNASFSSLGGILFNQAQTTLIQAPAVIPGSYSIPNGVTSVGPDAFLDNFDLTNLTLPFGVTDIGDGAFANDTGLQNIVFSSAVAVIADSAFYDCSSLSGIYFAGNAPSLGADVFGSAGSYDPATVYYLPGAIGWGSTFGGLPTAPWNLPYPVIPTGIPGFGLAGNQFGFTVSWATNLSVVVQATTDLENQAWSPISTNPLNHGTFYFNDPHWTNYRSRFYRIAAP
jgi:PKD repeat protein